MDSSSFSTTSQEIEEGYKTPEAMKMPYEPPSIHAARLIAALDHAAAVAAEQKDLPSQRFPWLPSLSAQRKPRVHLPSVLTDMDKN